MKQFLITLSFFVTGAVLFTACYKDKGNYTYEVPPAPVVTNLDTVYEAFVGDSLIIAPTVTISNNATLSYDWKIAVPKDLTELHFEGPALRTIFGLTAERYYARLTITNEDIDMKYFYDFAIDGKTAFAAGTTVLSDEDGTPRFSFIKPDGTVQARIYEAINTETLPEGSNKLLAVDQAYTPGATHYYWIFSSTGETPGVRIDANTMQKDITIRDNFFSAPDTLSMGTMKSTFMGVITGVINKRLFSGTTSTWNQAPTYGMFGLGTTGDYEMASSFIFNFNSGYYVGYDINRKQFLRFNLYGDPIYFGTSYTTIGEDFDPKNTGLDLVYMEQINGGNCYAFARDADGTLWELKFLVDFNAEFKFTTYYKRKFPQQDLLTASSQWQAASNEVFYFTTGTKIYRYNPVNGDLRTLTADMGGKEVTMIQLADSDNTLIAGVDGALYYLDISTGQYGTLIKKIDGIPGKPLGAAVRKG